METNSHYRYLKPKRGSRYRQLFFGRIRRKSFIARPSARTPFTPDQVAREYDVPVEAVLEAIDYCVRYKELLDSERAREDAEIKAAGRDKWPYAPATGPSRIVNKLHLR